MGERKAGKEAGVRFLALIVGALFFVGLIFLAVANNWKNHERTTHLLRDFGTACLISALVTILYEAYVRYRFDIAKIDTLLNTVYGSSIPLEVWNNIRENLLSRPVLRRNAAFHLRVSLHPSNTAVLVLETQLEYMLTRLTTGDYQVAHYLDSHISDADQHLPRFIHASLGAESFGIDTDQDWKSKDNSASFEHFTGCLTIKLPPANQSPPEVPVAIRRIEVRNLPGSYFFVMTEVTTGMRVYLEECPAAVTVKLSLWPPVPEINLSDVKYAFLSSMFLPGHALEFKFIASSQPAAQPPQAQVAQ